MNKILYAFMVVTSIILSSCNLKNNVTATELLSNQSESTANSMMCPKTLITGHIIQRPGKELFMFQRARIANNDGSYLSHVKFYILTSDYKVYEVSVDNLFYDNVTDLQARQNQDVGIIADFKKRFKLNDNVVACGDTYSGKGGLGIHWVHSSPVCEMDVRQKGSYGFLKINDKLITDNLKYCGKCRCYYINTHKVGKSAIGID